VAIPKREAIAAPGAQAGLHGNNRPLAPAERRTILGFARFVALFRAAKIIA
jgi:hypothetical protein